MTKLANLFRVCLLLRWLVNPVAAQTDKEVMALVKETRAALETDAEQALEVPFL